ncbi:alpha/beta fold hydrolase [Marinobacteraceae bacterium S3BR75-40.1]
MAESRNGVREGVVECDGLRLAYEVEGPEGAPAMVLVHGYPDSRRIWDALVPLLVPHYRVIRYDVRGAGHSGAPRRMADYRMSALEHDLACIIDTLSPDAPVHLVAHDWGSIQSWEAVTGDLLVGRLASFTSISGPCLDHVGFWFRDCWKAGEHGRVARQLAKSWYIFLFHLPLVAPVMWRTGLGRSWPDVVALWEQERPRPDPTQARQGRLGINLYRANMLPRVLAPRERYAHVPVHVIQPEGDQFVSPALSENLERWVPRLRRTVMPGKHWQVLAHPEPLADLIMDFIRRIDANTLDEHHGSRETHPV